jgi:glutathione S-transferase
MRPVLVIGNKSYSSWSMRPWLLLKVNGIDFDEVRIPLYQQTSKGAIFAKSPSGKVPALLDGSVAVWESLAICEYIAERWPDAGQHWPTETGPRARARSLAAEMHAGFAVLRHELPMNCRRTPAPPADGTADDLDEQIARIDEIFSSCRRDASGGEFLFGRFGIVDAMFAPVVLRFTIYQVPVSTLSRAYMQTIHALPALQEWLHTARGETEVLAQFER